MGFEVFIKLFFVILLLVTFGYIIQIVIGVLNGLPSSHEVNAIPPGQEANSIYQGTYGLLDESIIGILIFGVIIQIVAGTMYPRKGMAIVGVVELIGLVMISMVFNTSLLVVTNALSANQILPVSVSLYQGGYAVFITAFAIVISIILNMRDEDE
jgi:hypothetical protein